MGLFTYFLRDLEQIVFPNRDQHADPADGRRICPQRPAGFAAGRSARQSLAPMTSRKDQTARSTSPPATRSSASPEWVYRALGCFAEFDGDGGGLAVPSRRPAAGLRRRPRAGGDRRTGGRQTWLNQAGDQPLHCLTASCRARRNDLHDRWQCPAPAGGLVLDLMEKNHLGRLIACGPALDGAQRSAERDCIIRMGWRLSPDGKTLWFTESWNHRLSRAAVTGRTIARPRIVVAQHAGLSRAARPPAAGGFWLSVFAVRTHLVEFVLREDDYRAEMMQTIPRDVWIAPALATSNDCHEPMQFGAIKALGIEKPWAPPRSYGLLVRLDEEGDAMESLHSRVGGH